MARSPTSKPVTTSSRSSPVSADLPRNAGLSPTDDRDFAARFAAMSEDELMRLARTYDTLLEAAQDALRAEFAQRGLDPPLLDDSDDSDIDAAGPRPEQTLVTVRRYRDLSEAIVARSVLEGAGMFCFLQNENMVRLDWQLSNFIGGIRLQVAESDAGAAEQILSEPVPASIQMEGEPDYIQPRRPRCDSLDISFKGAGRGAALAALYLFGLPAPMGEKRWICNQCGLLWADDERAEGAQR